LVSVTNGCGGNIILISVRHAVAITVALVAGLVERRCIVLNDIGDSIVIVVG
jgi:hypothetical protein